MKKILFLLLIIIAVILGVVVNYYNKIQSQNDEINKFNFIYENYNLV